jgi:tetratricopeptide (TPR) repeat protein
MNLNLSKLIFLFIFIVTSFNFAVITDKEWQELKHYYKTYKENTSDINARYNLAMAYAYTGFLQEGFNELKYINNLDSNFKQNILEDTSLKVGDISSDWKVLFYHAFALYANEKKLEAQDYFYKVVDLTDSNSVKGWSLGYIAYIYGEQRNWKKGLEVINKAIYYEPNGVELFMAKAYAQQQLGDFFGVAGTLLRIGTIQASGVFNQYSIDRLKNEV